MRVRDQVIELNSMYKIECFYYMERKPKKEKDDGKGKNKNENKQDMDVDQEDEVVTVKKMEKNLQVINKTLHYPICI